MGSCRGLFIDPFIPFPLDLVHFSIKQWLEIADLGSRKIPHPHQAPGWGPQLGAFHEFFRFGALFN